MSPGPSPEELAAGVTVCPVCFRIGVDGCICGDLYDRASNAEYEQDQWFAAISRVIPKPEPKP